MKTLQFLPWCPIDKTYEAGKITLIPFKRDGNITMVDELGACQASRILTAYKDLRGHPVRNATLIRLGSKGLLDDLTEDERDISRDLVDLACFSGLAHRKHFGSSSDYCNSEHFVLYGHRFEKDPSYVTLQSKRSVGYSLDGGRSLAELVFSIPVNCSSPFEIKLDEPLLSALCGYRDKAREEEWGRWQNAISTFNLANTDNSQFRDQVDWVLLCSAFEHLLGSKPNADDVASKFTAALQPFEPILAKDFERSSLRKFRPDDPIRHVWMREFYGVRGDFAHGKRRPKQPLTWSAIEHLSLARIVFPLLVRSLLASTGSYLLPPKAQDEIDAFEGFAAHRDFLSHPPDWSGSSDTWWQRLLGEASSKRRRSKIVKELQELNKSNQAGDGLEEKNSHKHKQRE